MNIATSILPEPRANGDPEKAPKITDECLSTNWNIMQDNKKLSDCFTTLYNDVAPKDIALVDIVNSDTCVVLSPRLNIDEHDSCMIEMKLPSSMKITRMIVVSEASVIEFFKQSGEYAKTIFGEMLDVFEGAAVYIVEYLFPEPTCQASIKFTRVNNSRSNMYLYGIKVIIADRNPLPKSSRPLSRNVLGSMFNESFLKNPALGGKMSLDLLNAASVIDAEDDEGNFVEKMGQCLKAMSTMRCDKAIQKATTPIASTHVAPAIIPMKGVVEKSNIERYIDERTHEMEERLTKRINEAETKTMEKLDRILRVLEAHATAK